MQVYELGYLILPSIPEDGLNAVGEKIKGLVAKASGREVDGEEPIKVNLAYTMSKTVGASRYVVNDAYIGWIKFEAEPDAISGLKDSVEDMEEVLRSLVIKAPRETTFTFAQAREKLKSEEEKEMEAQAPERLEETVVE